MDGMICKKYIHHLLCLVHVFLLLGEGLVNGLCNPFKGDKLDDGVRDLSAPQRNKTSEKIAKAFILDYLGDSVKHSSVEGIINL